MGDSHFASSIFPPHPSVFQGAIRGKIISEKCGFDAYQKQIDNITERGDLWESIGGPEGYGKLRIKGPIIAEKKEGIVKEFFPVPLDISMRLMEEPASLVQFDIEGFIPLKKVCPQDGKGNFIDKDTLVQYLKRQPISPEEKDIFWREERTGIKIGPYRTAEEGMLYTAEFIRMAKDMGFVLYVDGVDSLLLPEGLLALGGKARAAHYEKINNREEIIAKEEIKNSLMDCDGFKLYLATPAIFKGGWKPDFVGDDNKGNYNGLSFEFVTADLEKPLYIGGFDVRNKQPKPLRRAVPPGSVYYFKPMKRNTMKEIAEKVIETFHEKCISYFDHEIGFGLCFVGGWKYV